MNLPICMVVPALHRFLRNQDPSRSLLISDLFLREVVVWIGRQSIPVWSSIGEPNGF